MYNYISKTLSYNMQINRSIYHMIIAIGIIYKTNWQNLAFLMLLVILFVSWTKYTLVHMKPMNIFFITIWITYKIEVLYTYIYFII